MTAQTLTQIPDSHIPANERDMENVKEGDLVLITAGDNTTWALYEGLILGIAPTGVKRDSFLFQGIGCTEDVLTYSQNRTSHNYDKQRGIILAGKDCSDFCNKPNSYYYLEYVNKLKQAGLWQEQNQVAEVTA